MAAGCPSASTLYRDVAPGGKLATQTSHGLAAIAVVGEHPVSRLVLAHKPTGHQVDLGPIDAGENYRVIEAAAGTWCVETIMLGQAEFIVAQPPCFTLPAGTATYVGRLMVAPAGYRLERGGSQLPAGFAVVYPDLATMLQTQLLQVHRDDNVEVDDPDA